MLLGGWGLGKERLWVNNKRSVTRSAPKLHGYELKSWHLPNQDVTYMVFCHVRSRSIKKVSKRCLCLFQYSHCHFILYKDQCFDSLYMCSSLCERDGVCVWLGLDFTTTDEDENDKDVDWLTHGLFSLLQPIEPHASVVQEVSIISKYS